MVTIWSVYYMCAGAANCISVQGHLPLWQCGLELVPQLPSRL